MNRRSLFCFLPLGALLALALSSCGGGGGGSSSGGGIPPVTPPAESITITTPTDIKCVLNLPFSLTLQATGNATPVTWSVTTGQLPQGLTLDPATGVISGTPSSGSGLVTVRAADAKVSATKLFSFSLFSQLVINPVTPTPAHLGAPYSLNITTQGSIIASWTVSAGQLPPGLQLTPSGQGIISGTPTQVGTFPFTILAQDNTLPQVASLDLTIVVDSRVTIVKNTLLQGSQDHPYSDSFRAVNGAPPLQWTASGMLPSGISLDPSTGALSGTPGNSGYFSFTVSVQDSSSPPQSDSAQASFIIIQKLQVGGNPGTAYLAQPYFSNLGISGGTYPYDSSLLSGSLPPGLSLSSYGQISGVPTQLGSYSFVVRVTDATVPPYQVDLPVTLTVSPPPLVFLGNPATPAPVNVPYHSQIPAYGGTPPYNWAVASGQLPPGLSLDPSTGFIDGTPTQVGSFLFGINGTDSGTPPQISTPSATITVRQPLGRNDSITTATPIGNNVSNSSLSLSPYIDPIGAPSANPDNDYYRLLAPGGSLVHVETVAARSWGPNAPDTVLEILDESGVRLASCRQPTYTAPCLNDDIDGTTTDSLLDLRVPGPASVQAAFYVHVLDFRGDARPNFLYYLNVTGVVDLLIASPSTLGRGATRGVPYQQQFSTSGGTGSVTWTLDGGSLPPGWAFSPAGLLSGTATTDGFYTFVLKATDSANPPQSVRTSFSLQIAEPLVITSSPNLPDACINQPYSFTPAISGGIPPIQWGLSSASWPALAFDRASGTTSGTPTVLGTFQAIESAADSAQPPSGQIQNLTLHVVTCP